MPNEKSLKEQVSYWKKKFDKCFREGLESEDLALSLNEKLKEATSNDKKYSFELTALRNQLSATETELSKFKSLDGLTITKFEKAIPKDVSINLIEICINLDIKNPTSMTIKEINQLKITLENIFTLAR